MANVRTPWIGALLSIGLLLLNACTETTTVEAPLHSTATQGSGPTPTGVSTTSALPVPTTQPIAGQTIPVFAPWTPPRITRGDATDPIPEGQYVALVDRANQEAKAFPETVLWVHATPGRLALIVAQDKSDDAAKLGVMSEGFGRIDIYECALTRQQFDWLSDEFIKVLRSAADTFAGGFDPTECRFRALVSDLTAERRAQIERMLPTSYVLLVPSSPIVRA